MRFDFLLCSERSGSNLVTQLLNAHSQVCGPFPSHLVQRVAPHVWRYGDLGVDAAWRALLHDVEDYLRAMHSTWSRVPTAAELDAEARFRDFGEVLRSAYTLLATSEGKSRVFVKDNKAASNLGFIEATFEAPRYVFVVRDPRDMALTWRDNAVEPGGVHEAVSCWLDDQLASLRAEAILGPKGRIHRLRFEDLLLAPEPTLSALCEFLGLTYEPGMLDFHAAQLLQTNAGALSSWTDLARPLDPSVVGRYRERLSEAEVRYIEAATGELMPRFGYAPDFRVVGDVEALRAGLPEGTTTAADPAELAIFARWYAVTERIATRPVTCPAGGPASA